MKKIINKIVFFLLIASSIFVVKSAEQIQKVPNISSPRVLLGEGHMRGEMFGCFVNSVNYDDETTHHIAEGYCTVSLGYTPNGKALDVNQDITGDLVDIFTWENIGQIKRFLIADMTFSAQVTASRIVTERALAALESGGIYLIPVMLYSKNDQWTIKIWNGDDELLPEQQIEFSEQLTNYGIPIGNYTSLFPNQSVFDEGSKVIEQLMKKEYPCCGIERVDLRAAPLARAFWRLDQDIQDSLLIPLEEETLFSYLFEQSEPEELPGPEEIEKAKTYLHQQPTLMLSLAINFHLSKNLSIRQQLISLAKEEAKQEEQLFGDFFGPHGTTFSFPYTPERPFENIPTYIAVQKK